MGLICHKTQSTNQLLEYTLSKHNGRNRQNSHCYNEVNKVKLATVVGG